MFHALENSDYQAFTEFNNFRQQAEKQLVIAQGKFEATNALFLVEKAKKDERDMNEEVKR